MDINSILKIMEIYEALSEVANFVGNLLLIIGLAFLGYFIDLPRRKHMRKFYNGDKP